MTDSYLQIVTHPLLWIFVGLSLTAFFIQWITAQKPENWTSPAEHLERFGKGLGLGGTSAAILLVAGLTWLVILLTLLFGLYKLVLEMIWYPAPADKEALWNWRFALAQLAAITTILGAVIALPLTLNRLILARRQTETAENQLFNNKLNSATTDLAARHQVTREIGRGQQKRILTEWQDDLLTRAAAIDRLEGLAHEREEEAPRIARTLSLYVRELTRIYAPETAPDDAPVAELRAWAQKIQPVRPDMESAAQSLGQLQSPQMPEAEPVKIDLRHANLQGFNLNSLRLRNAQLTGAALQGANFIRAKLQGADFRGAEFDEHTNLSAATLRGAALRLVDFTNIPQIAVYLGDVFGDGTVILPGGHGPDHADWPAHWPKEKLTYPDFREKWREWQAGLEGYEAPEPLKGGG